MNASTAGEEGFIDVPGGRVFYRSVGQGGVPVLCLHGGRLDSLWSISRILPIAARSCSATSLDAGRSTAPNYPALWGGERFVEELVA
jgi:pimeloyl-ACP methyl ester carboxylesterase